MYDAETLMRCIVGAEGRRARYGVSGHCHINCMSVGIGWHGL